MSIAPSSVEPRVALVAGEASGDQLGAALVIALRERYPRIRLFGIGGPRMRAAGFEAWWDCSELAVMGLFEVLRHLPRLLRLRRELRARLLEVRPDILVGIDAPDFNLGLETALRRAGITTAHYVSPTVWAWRARRVKKIARAVDAVLCLFPFEPAFYTSHGVPAHYTGHPLADQIPMHSDKLAARTALGLPAEGLQIGLLPGSRLGEINRLTAPLLDAARLLAQRHPGCRFLIPLPNPGARSAFESVLSQYPGLDCSLFDGQALRVMAAADVVACASGTASLECMLVKRPMVVVYRLAPATYHLARSLRLVKSSHIALPNILSGQTLVPELIQDAVTGPAIAQALEAWLAEPARSAELLVHFKRLHAELRHDAAASAARVIAGLLGSAEHVA